MCIPVSSVSVWISVFANNGVECKQLQDYVFLRLRYFTMNMHLTVKRNKIVTIHSWGFSYILWNKTRISGLNMQIFLLVRCVHEGREVSGNYKLLIMQCMILSFSCHGFYVKYNSAVGGLAILCDEAGSDTFWSYHLQRECETKEGSGLIYNSHTGGWSMVISNWKGLQCCQKCDARLLSLYLSSVVKWWDGKRWC